VLNQTPPRSYRLADAAAALSDVAVELNLMGVLACPTSCCATISRTRSAPACP